MHSLKEIARRVRKKEQFVANEIRLLLEPVLGHRKSAPLFQVYLNNSSFSTVVSVNHFIEFFSNQGGIKLDYKFEFYSRGGEFIKSLHREISDSGASQLDLAKEVSGLDEFGTFSVDLDIYPKYKKSIEYLGRFGHQFMTLFIPRDDRGAPQIIHSHKIKQGSIITKRKHRRASGHIENLKDLERIEFYVPNSCATLINSKIIAKDAESGKVFKEYSASIPGYGINCFSVDPSDFVGARYLSFDYEYDRSVDHKKPIVFRKNRSGIWSANHT